MGSWTCGDLLRVTFEQNESKTVSSEVHRSLVDLYRLQDWRAWRWEAAPLCHLRDLCTHTSHKWQGAHLMIKGTSNCTALIRPYYVL
jgi:hypothetical protein